MLFDSIPQLIKHEFQVLILKKNYKETLLRFSRISANPIKSKPEIVTQSGVSFGKIAQPKIAPETGIRNFQKLSSDTLTPGLRSKVVQIVIAAADKKLSQPRATKYSPGKGFWGMPSNGIEIRIKPAPPTMSDDEVRIMGDTEQFLRAMTTFVIPEVILFSIK